MKSPKISVIIPTYNVERYVEECIESVLNQSYENIEIIVIDDGSTDTTPYLLKKFKNSLSLTLNSDNQGQGEVRNEGIEKASGGYILFVDSDDFIESTTAEKLVQAFEKTKAQLIRFNGKAFQENMNPTLKQNQYDFSSILEENKVYIGSELLEVNRKSFSASPCLYAVKKDVLTNKNIKFPQGFIHEDDVFTTHLFTEAESMTYLNEALYHRRYRVSSTMTELSKAHKVKSFKAYFKAFEKLEELYLKSEYSKDQKKFVKRQMMSVYNGLLNADVPPQMKKDLRDIKTLSVKDKLQVRISDLRQKHT